MLVHTIVLLCLVSSSSAATAERRHLKYTPSAAAAAAAAAADAAATAAADAAAAAARAAAPDVAAAARERAAKVKLNAKEAEDAPAASASAVTAARDGGWIACNEVFRYYESHGRRSSGRWCLPTSREHNLGLWSNQTCLSEALRVATRHAGDGVQTGALADGVHAGGLAHSVSGFSSPDDESHELVQLVRATGDGVDSPFPHAAPVRLHHDQRSIELALLPRRAVPSPKTKLDPRTVSASRRNGARVYLARTCAPPKPSGPSGAPPPSDVYNEVDYESPLFKMGACFPALRNTTFCSPKLHPALNAPPPAAGSVRQAARI